MSWCTDDEIGEIPKTYNYLIGYYTDEKDPKAIHYTDGGPWYRDYQDVEYAQEWRDWITPVESIALQQSFD